MPVGNGLTRARHRRIEPGDLLRGAIAMPDDVAESRGSGPSPRQAFAAPTNSARCSPVRLQQFPRRTLVEQTGDDDVGLEHQHVFGAARQCRIAARSSAGRDCQRIAREPAEARGFVRDPPASAATDRCRRSSTRCAADWRQRRSRRRSRTPPRSRAEIRNANRITDPPTARSQPRADIPRDRR